MENAITTALEEQMLYSDIRQDKTAKQQNVGFVTD